MLAQGSNGTARLSRYRCPPSGHPRVRLICPTCRAAMAEGRHWLADFLLGSWVAERWYEGLWLGKRFTSNEDFINLGNGKVVLARATKERPEAVRLTMKMLDEITAPPWKPMTTLSDAHTHRTRELPTPEAAPTHGMHG